VYAANRKQFGRKKDFSKKNDISSTSSSSPPFKSIYSLPALYDLAFGYRDYEDEVSFLMRAHARVSAKTPRRVLEVAAGPARHAVIAATRVEKVTCVDSSPEMKAYAETLATEELGNTTVSKFEYSLQDMRSFALSDAAKFDTAWILLGSLQHLTTNQDVIDCFRSVSNCLDVDGTIILELPHPRETFQMTECTRNGWEIPLDDEDGNECGELKIIWGDENDSFDPIGQVRQFTVSFQVTGVVESEDIQNVRQVVPMRLFTAQDIDALATCAGLQVVQMYGALESEVDVDVRDEDLAFRLVCVLKKLVQ
jgi:SAM-dependent methyltransferase